MVPLGILRNFFNSPSVSWCLALFRSLSLLKSPPTSPTPPFPFPSQLNPFFEEMASALARFVSSPFGFCFSSNSASAFERPFHLLFFAFNLPIPSPANCFLPPPSPFHPSQKEARIVGSLVSTLCWMESLNRIKPCADVSFPLLSPTVLSFLTFSPSFPLKGPEGPSKPFLKKRKPYGRAVFFLLGQPLFRTLTSFFCHSLGMGVLLPWCTFEVPSSAQ